ncbi:MAG: hypothetical protein ACK4ND_08095 [Cytophagaceae bacterium]
MILTNRIKILSAIVVVLSIAAWFALQEKNRVASFEGNITFNISDYTAVHEVAYEKRGKKNVLKKKEEFWVLNNRFPVREQLIDLMFLGFSKSEIRRPVAEENRKNVIQNILQNGFKVSIKEGPNTFEARILANENDQNSAYFLVEGTDVPFITFVPGFTGNITNVFDLNELDWRHRGIFASDNRSLQSISVSYPATPSDDFKIKFAKGTFEVEGVAAVDTMALVDYLNQYQFVNVSGYFENADSVKSLFASKPFAVISVVDINEGLTNDLIIYQKKDEKYWYALIGKSDEPVIVKDELVKRLLQRRSSFKARTN